MKVKPAQGKTANPEPAEFQALPLGELTRGPSDSAPTDSLQEFCIHRIHTGICVCVWGGEVQDFSSTAPPPISGDLVYIITLQSNQVFVSQSWSLTYSIQVYCQEAWASDHLVLATGIFNEFATISRINKHFLVNMLIGRKNITVYEVRNHRLPCTPKHIPYNIERVQQGAHM